MSNKVRIGAQSDMAERAMNAEQDARDATSDLTMMKRRVRTFYLEVGEVLFPEDAPSWAPDWVEWILTGQVATVGEEALAGVGTPPVVEEVAAEAAEVVEEAAVDAAVVSDDAATDPA